MVLTALTDPVIIPELQVPQALLEHLAVQAHPDLPERPELPADLVAQEDPAVQEDPVFPMDLMAPADQVTINVSLNLRNIFM